ncbi:hypothetical protein R3W88_007490 [Solanum pinnatisectum]|uniref:DUF4283 domain-containing protein n=1 Tax=Solanum pinnatisectum TaxID=50273 RepID=A0AAV9M7S7_9SOLN|nr:hypothetical protein R3W88_007490 [Solanum pinnatisectum]
MTKKSKQGGRGQQIQAEDTSNMVGNRKVPQSGDARQTKNINVIQGIMPLNLAHTPPQMGNQTTRNPSSWANQVEEETMMKQVSGMLHLSPPSVVHSWSKIIGNGETIEGFDFSGSKGVSNVKITMDDIRKEVEYWNITVICYVLGSNPPQSVMQGYFNRIWKGMGIEKIAQVNRGVFLVRFHCQDSRSKVVENGVQMFDRKPVVGNNALTKIVGLVGNPLKADTTTTNKVRLTYARVLMEMPLNKDYPTGIMFENEIRKIIEQKVEYEWKPVWCTKCKNYGHELKEFKRQQRDADADSNKGNREDGQQRSKEIQEEAQVDKPGNRQCRDETFKEVRSPGRRILHTPRINITTITRKV